MAREYRQANGLTVEKFNVIGTDLWIFQAWEPSGRAANGRPWRHSSLTTIDACCEQTMGKVGTRDLTPELEALPAYSEERFAAVTAWHEAQYQEAYTAILAAFPEAALGRRSDGSVTVVADYETIFDR